jgi:hypothetical protein
MNQISGKNRKNGGMETFDPPSPSLASSMIGTM